jgi:hypothetical protein
VTEATLQTCPVLRYTVFEYTAFGMFRAAAELDAASDREALREARRIVPHGSGELRQGYRTVCRFGRA